MAHQPPPDVEVKVDLVFTAKLRLSPQHTTQEGQIKIFAEDIENETRRRSIRPGESFKFRGIDGYKK